MKRQYINLDSNEGIFFEKQLEHIKSKTYDVLYPELLARRLFPVDNSADPGAATITYQTWDHLGVAKIIHSYAMDLPSLEIVAKETTRKVYSQGISFGYSIQDVRAANYAGVPLQQRKANAARRQMLQLENKIAFHGNDSTNGVPGTDIPGFINNSNINVVTMADDASTSSTLWSAKTATEIITDIGAMVSAIRVVSNGVESPNTLLLPEKQYTQISTTPRSSTSDTTILEYVLKSNAWIKEIIPVYDLAGTGTAGGTWDSEDSMILYDRNPDKLTLEVPQDVEFFSAQEKGLKFEIPVHSRTAGVIIYYPKSIAQGIGI